MCVSAPNILASILHHTATKVEICFLCLVNIFYCIDKVFAASPNISRSLCGGRISNTTKKPMPGYIDVFQSSESTKRATKRKKSLALATSTKLVA